MFNCLCVFLSYLQGKIYWAYNSWKHPAMRRTNQPEHNSFITLGDQRDAALTVFSIEHLNSLECEWVLHLAANAWYTSSKLYMCDAGKGPVVADRRLVVNGGCWPLLADHIHPDNRSPSACIVWTVNLRNAFHLWRERPRPAAGCNICTYVELKHSHSDMKTNWPSCRLMERLTTIPRKTRGWKAASF